MNFDTWITQYLIKVQLWNCFVHYRLEGKIRDVYKVITRENEQCAAMILFLVFVRAMFQHDGVYITTRVGNVCNVFESFRWELWGPGNIFEYLCWKREGIMVHVWFCFFANLIVIYLRLPPVCGCSCMLRILPDDYCTVFFIRTFNNKYVII